LFPRVEWNELYSVTMCVHPLEHPPTAKHKRFETQNVLKVLVGSLYVKLKVFVSTHDVTVTGAVCR